MFLTRVILKNYKSIAACDVKMQPLMFLVGPNGSGKSNFLDALRFVADGLRSSLDHALRDRGGIKEVRRRSVSGHPTHFRISLEFTLSDGSTGDYAFRIGARPQGGYEVQEESCEVRYPDPSYQLSYFKVVNGEVKETSAKVAPTATSDRLYLVTASGLPEFRSVYEAFSRMAFYHINPDWIRELQYPEQGELLDRGGSNIASVFAQMSVSNSPGIKRIEEYLTRVVPGIQGVDVKPLGPAETLEFRQQVAGSKYPWRFYASSMSDGTLRALGVLVALFQSGTGPYSKLPLVGIEEPELALHPGAAGVLLDGLREASQNTQVIVTSHSPDLLDDPDLDTDSILVVVSDSGITRIGPIDQAGRSILHDRLYTAGELLRLNQFAPDPALVSNRSNGRHRLVDQEKP